MSPVTSAPHSLRRDAARNRVRILDAARGLFAEGGLSVTLDEIAQAAGVGVGTVYRRFGDKERLIEALFEERLARVERIARDAHALDDAWAGIASFLERLLELTSEDRGLRELLLGTEHGRVRVEATRGEVTPLVADLVARAKAAGQIRTDVEETDVALVQLAVSELDTLVHRVAPDAWRRLLAVALDGLRAGTRPTRATPLPGPPLGEQDVAAVLAQYRPRVR